VRPRLFAFILILVAVMRMAATFHVFAHTADEPTHVGAGLELIQNGTYWLHRDNPPLPRVIMAIAPWLGGMRIDLSKQDFSAKLRSVMYGHGRYTRNLELMRSGNLLFFILASWALWMWTRMEADETIALLALLLFTMQPIVLGYSALATHDGPATAGVAVALLALSSWFRNPTPQRAAIAGVAYGFAILCKLSCIAFVPLAWLAILAIRRQWKANLLLAMPVAALIVWAGYGFAFGNFGDLPLIADGFGPRVSRMILSHPSFPLPAPAFFWGIASLMRQNRAGFTCYFFGAQSKHGWLMYFPAAIVLKTTLPFLALFIAGIVTKRRLMLEALAAAVAIVAVAMTSNLDLGVRYVLPAYVPLSFAAAIGAAAMLRASRPVAVALIALHCAVSVASHPDYFPYFNALAWPEPGRYLIDSNLDWGQDVLRLRSELRRRKIDGFGQSLMGGADLDALRFPPSYPINPWIATDGWLAVSEHSYQMQKAEGAWTWLERASYTRVGKSIRLYRLR
jgi:4-amino-4-deoxy-L-arabinose transferase-like glycosyltransferase